MRMVYAARGEKGGCINISNLGAVTLPDITFRSAMFLWSLYCVVFFSALGIFLLIAAIVPALRQYLARKFFI